jgi:hypothetical protein
MDTNQEPTPAEVAEELQRRYFHEMDMANTPIGFYNDEYGMDDFPEDHSNEAEKRLYDHLEQHLELQNDPEWAGYYKGMGMER